MNRDAERDPKVEEVWRSYLTTGKPPKSVNLPLYESPVMRTVARRMPTDPRCQICYYPFSGLGGKLVRSLFSLEPSKMNPHLCNICERFADENPGGVELEVALLFGDIRGSTPLASKMSAYEFGQLINRFYQVTTSIIFKHGGMVEKLVGDEVTAFFVPAFTENHNFSRAAVKAGQEILEATGHDKADGPWVSVGVGIHTGEAYVGAVGEIVVSDDTHRLAGLDRVDLEFRSLILKGKDKPVDAWIYRSGDAQAKRKIDSTLVNDLHGPNGARQAKSPRSQAGLSIE